MSESWKQDAACRDHPTDLFFFDEAGDKRTQIRTAKAICAGCPVRQQCLDYAVEHHIEDGIFGGLTFLDRRRRRWAHWTERQCVRCHQVFVTKTKSLPLGACRHCHDRVCESILGLTPGAMKHMTMDRRTATYKAVRAKQSAES